MSSQFCLEKHRLLRYTIKQIWCFLYMKAYCNIFKITFKCVYIEAVFIGNNNCKVLTY